MAAVRLYGVLHRLIDQLDARPHRYIIKQEFNIVIAQANAPLADAQPNAKVSVGAVDGVQPADVDRIQPHRIIRPGRHQRRQGFALFRILAPGIGGRNPGRSLLLALYRRHPVTRGFASGLANADWQHFHTIAQRRVIIETHFGDVDDDPFAHGVRQDQLLRNNQRRTGVRQIDIDTGVGLQHIAQPLAVLGSKTFQRLGVVLRDGDGKCAAHQTTSLRRQRITDGQRAVAGEQHQRRTK